ncbi:hypothetical protein [Pectinatus frisingensis]|uniref:hypothetical protein n=1 Tax=Pectinatus frisingensis TaxID=865 RepID=UPI0018C6355B
MHNNIRGILYTFIFAIPAYFLGNLFPIIGGPVFAILLGILAAGFKRPATFEPGHHLLRWNGVKKPIN